MDEALVPHAKRLRIERSNFRLLSDIRSKESTLQLVYDNLRLSPFFKAFPVTADVSKIYMQEFWATTTVHHHSIRFKMDNKKHIVNLESFREMLHICPRLPHQPFVEPPFEEEILAFLWFLDIGLYHKRNVDFAYLMWEDFVYQVEHKDTKKSNEMYYPRFTKKEYYAVAIGAAPPKPKASVWKTKSSSDTTITPPTAAAGPRLTTSEKGKQAAKASKAKSLSALSEVAMTEAQQLKLVTNRSLQQTHISQASGSGADEGTSEDNDDDQEVKRDDEKDDKEEGGDDKQEYDEEEYNKETRDEKSMESIFETTSQMDAQTPTSVAPLPMSAPTMTPSTISTITTTQQAPLPLTTASSTLLQDLPNFGSLFGFDNRLKTLEANFSEFMQTNQFARAVSAIPEIVQRYMDQGMNEAVKFKKKMMSFSRLLMKTCRRSSRSKSKNKSRRSSRSKVKEQVQVQVSKILPKIEKTVNEQLEAEVLTQSSHSSKTSYVVAANLSEMELKKILIEKMEGNKETITLKRCCDDDADKDEEPFAGPDRGSKRRREGKEPESASAPTETATRSAGKSTQGTKSRQALASESAIAEELMPTTFQIEDPSHPEFDICAKDQPIVQSSQHPEWFSQQQKPPTPDRD
nr:hypothetical protein [Tanacetum cinerariifolium]